MKNYKYILFDLDGTLTDSKEGITKSFQYALADMGIVEDNLDNLERVIGPSLKESFRDFYGLNEKECSKAIKKYRERFEDIGLYENKIYNGIIDLLKNLTDEGVLLAVASSKPTVYVEKICKYFGIDKYFHHIIGSFLDGRRSKKEEVVDEAIARFGHAQLSKIIMVGDRKFDIEGARQRGIKSIGVTFGYGGYEELKEAGADYIVDSVEALKKKLVM
jgi:phosphoglycolate phosphatase